MYAVKHRKGIAILLMVAIIFSMAPVSMSYASESDKPDLLITELVPDSANVASKDAYEFVEIYNNTDETIEFKDYELRYRYGATDTHWNFGASYSSMLIPSREAIVIWVQTVPVIGVTTEQFNNNYSTQLVEGTNLFKIITTGGMDNANSRTLAIVDPTILDENSKGTVVSQATYDNDEQTKPDKGIFYRMPNEGDKAMVMMDNPGTINASPGSITPDQLLRLDEVVTEVPIALQHTPSTYRLISTNDFVIEAAISNAINTVDGKVYYKFDDETAYTEMDMAGTLTQQNTTIVSSQLISHNKLTYYIEVIADNQAPIVTPIYDITIVNLDENSEETPIMLVTELLPNSNNVGGSDAYEFIEIYNNTDEDINFKDYKLYYIYTDSGRTADVVWATQQEDIIIKAMDTMVFWNINSANGSLTVADFNKEFKTNLVENENIVKLYNDGLANGSKRGIAIGTNTHQDISVAYYDGSRGSVVNKGSHYQYQVGNTEMFEFAVGTIDASPGYVLPNQVPAVPMKTDEDNEEPVFTNLTEVTEVDEITDLKIQAEVTDNKSVKSVVLYYKTDQDSTYSKRYLYDEKRTNQFAYTVNSTEFIGRNEVTYYFEYSDGANSLTSPMNTVNITKNGNDDGTRLNVNNNEIISGTTTLKAASDTLTPDELQLSIDGQEVVDTYTALESEAYFVFEATDVNYYFKNGVTMGTEILHTFLDPINTYTTIKVPISAERLALGNNEIAVRAGTKSGPFDDRPEENKDDFKIRNVRLILADGTNIYDPAYNNKDTIIKMGDSAGMHEAIEFKFELTSDNLLALAYDWNTLETEDGEHIVKVVVGNEQVEKNVIVDNTSPTIVPSITNDEVLRSEFTLDAVVTDNYAGVKSVEATLNGDSIELPYETSTGALASGTYSFAVTATDTVGNRSVETVTFTIDNDNPNSVKLITPLSGSKNVGLSPTLKVKVTDPQEDLMSVLFKRGFHYDSQRKAGFSAYSGSSTVEPPKQKVPSTETKMNSSALKEISAIDSKYYTTDATEQFPYQRFEIKLDSSVVATDEVEINWKGNSLEGRKVSLYAWNPTEGKWDLLDNYVAGLEDFELNANVHAGDYNDNGVINVMVQDERPVTEDEYDFSFVWMSDTQYYSESYPEIYTTNTQWIVDNQEEMDIRYVIHTGDLVDDADQPYQWEAANNAMEIIEKAKIPYGVLAGNHDVGHQTGDYSYYWEHYGEDRFKDTETYTYGGSYQNNRGHYDLISAGGIDFIMVYMGWNIGDEEIDWVEQVVKDHPDRKAILSFHEYMLVSNNRAPIADEIYERVVVPYPNVIATLSGHYHDAETLVDEIDDNGDGIADRKVYQMLADYQGAEMGGLGYIRLLQFDLDNDQIHVKTYSPYLDDYNYYDPTEYPGKDEFDIDVDLGVMNKRVATDYFEVNIHTKQVIGEVTDVASGSEASVQWNQLKQGTNYEWYVEATDQFSGKTVSPIWNFTTTGGTTGTDPSTPAPTPNPSETPEASNNTITVNLEDVASKESEKTSITVNRTDGKPVDVVVTREAISQLAQNGHDLEIVVVGQTITIPSSTWSGLASDETLKITVVSKEQRGTTDKLAKEFLHASNVLDVKMTATSLVNVAESREVEGKMTLEFDITSLDADLVGIYQLVDGQPVYVGGKVDAQTIQVDVKQSGQYFVAEYVKSFQDITDHWAERSISILASKHIVNGTSANHYSPATDVQRGDFTTALIRSLGIYDPQASEQFTDVNVDAYYAGFVTVASELGIVQGSNNAFRPIDKVTREEAVVMLMRAYRTLNPDKTVNVGEQADFTDMDDVSEWATKDIREAQALSLIQGKNGHNVDPKGQLTRAELAQMIVNFLAITNK
ncbi:S-layer homology domain-containing protein [Paenibacillus endoradicis]|uniref:S-layer homology domain-containing protein n=1 Tax=Paenibacillus endoradicis TaxID=2972487 RepID=UPI002158E6FB|nr:S-layer homology domain-containing protein [Paenibacillus endoradicis]MCR8657360.1 S-layer homology domain-containing protein [Paenibacillus endoradicis]